MKPTKAISDYMSKIGTKGGSAGKGSPARAAAAKKAALARWSTVSKLKPKKTK
jgi:hypothetical protein